MGIEYLTGIGNMNSYYHISNVPVVNSEELKKKQEISQTDELQQNKEKELPHFTPAPKEDQRSKSADLNQISLTFHKEESYGYLGSETSLANLDMQKAISDMQKDQVLEEYQYFVGSAQNLMQPSEDGTVLQKYMDNN